MARELKWSPKDDQAPDNIFELLDSDRVKVYPYILPNLGKHDYFLGDGVTVIVSVTQNGIENLDAGGSIPVILTSQNGVTLDTEGGAEALGKKLISSRTISFTSPKWIKHDLEDIKKGNLTFKPVIFTIGKPLDIDKYDKGEQPVYFMSSFDEIDEYTREMRGLPEDGIYNVAGVSAQSLAAQYKYGKIMFNMGVLDTNIGNNPDNLVLTLPNTSLLHKVNLRGKLQKGSNTDFESTNISLKTDGKNLLPFKGTPISTAHGLDIYADWFDYDMTMPWFVAEVFKTPQPLSKLKDLKQGDTSIFDDVDIQCIIDMMAVAVGYGNTWKDIARANGNESGWDGAKQQIGKIYPNTTVGTVKFSIPGLEGQDPIKAIDGVYETYLRVNVGKEGTLASKIVKQIICALSRFVYSSYAIGKGQNSFNQIYLPWYLKPQDALSLSAGNPNGNGYTQEKNYVLNQNTKFVLDSQYFDLNTLKNKETQTNISDIKMVQTDRKLTLPTVPLQIQEQTKLPLPGDIATNSSTDLQYMWYIPTSSDGKKIFLDSVVSANQTETRSPRKFTNYQTELNTDYLNPLSSRTEPDKKQFIQNDILSKNSRNGITAGDIVYDFSTISFPHQTFKHDIPVTVTLGTYTSNGTLDMTLTNTITSKDFTVTLQSRMTTDAKDLTDEFKTFFAPILVTNDLDVKLSFDNEVYFQNYPIHINITTNSGTFVYTINPGEKAKNFQMTVDFIFELIQIPNLTLNNFPNITFAIDRNAAFSKVAFEEEIVNILNWQSLDLKLSEIKDRNIAQVDYIIITAIFEEYMNIKINNNFYVIPSVFSKDETISQQTIVLA